MRFGALGMSQHPKGERVVRYPKFTTTVVGAHSVPDWYEALDRLLTVGPAFDRISGRRAVPRDPGRDPRPADCRHRYGHRRRDASAHPQSSRATERDAESLLAEDSGLPRPTRPKPITPHDPNVFHPAATCRARIGDATDLGLVDEFKMVSMLRPKPVKVTMTGPHMLAKVAYDEHYDDMAR